MKYLKLYEENIENVPKIGDYVICKDKSIAIDNNTKEFISNNIGKIIAKPVMYIYIVKYDYNAMPEIVMYLDEIIKFSKDRTELEEYLMAKKYGL
jgi:hypothetical protein